MIEFIPPCLDDSCKSPAERKIFQQLHSLGFEYATILHSLGVPKHTYKKYGEIDFVILCEQGIVCLEIKGGAVSFINGVWQIANRTGQVTTKNEGPFAQAVGNMCALQERIIAHFKNYPRLKKVNFACGVMFPDIRFDATGEEIIPEIIYDLDYPEAFITEYISGLFQYWGERNASQPGTGFARLSREEIDVLKEFLRGDFGFVPSLRTIFEQTDRELLRLTEDQYALLEALSGNPRMMISGPAGTGKTLLAVEHARQNAAAGLRTLLLVYNRNLANALKPCEVDGLTITHIHGLIAKYLPIEPTAPGYFGEQIFRDFFDKLTSIVPYDVLVIDEAQDILSDSFLPCMDRLVNGGVNGGVWTIFYDKNQNIFHSDMDACLAALYAASTATFQLQHNCRNTKQIGLFNAYTTGFPAAKFHKGEGVNVEIICYQNATGFRANMEELLTRLTSEGVDVNDIVILSPYKYENSILSASGALRTMYSILSISDNREGIRFSTIQGFKGLDRKVILLCDIDKMLAVDFQKLFYTGASRARAALYVFCTEGNKAELDRRYIQNGRAFSEAR